MTEANRGSMSADGAAAQAPVNLGQKIMNAPMGLEYSSHPSTLLIVEDNPADIEHYIRLLEEFDHGFERIHYVSSITEAKCAFADFQPDCCLLDNFLPDGCAEDLLQYLLSQHADTPAQACAIIVLTGLDDSQTAVNLMQSGAQDYLIKQHLDAILLQKSIQNALKTNQLQAQLSYMALYDALTGLVNRPLFLDRLTQIFEESKRYDRMFALFYIDLNDFKNVNDHYGHAAGDCVLEGVAEKMRKTLRSSDTAARIGGDEFMVLLPDITEAKAHHVAFKLVNKLNFEVEWRDQSIPTSATIGLTFWPNNSANSCEQLIHEADVALYRAKKQAGRLKMAAFNAQDAADPIRQNETALALPQAITNNTLQLAWLPIVCLETNRMTGMEALVRWQDDGHWIAPENIIDMVMGNRLSTLFHRWLFHQSLSQFAQWLPENPSLKIALNFPASMCHDKQLIDMLIEALNRFHLPPSTIIVEITEANMMRYPAETRQQLMRLAEHDIEIAIDDYGTASSSLKYLATLPCDSLKIDRSFFLDLDHHPENLRIIDAITALAHRLGMKVVAEGIETEALFQSAKSVGCDFAQGYFFSKPKIINAKTSLCDSFPNCPPSADAHARRHLHQGKRER